MIDIFLSASVPLPTRDRKFFDTADVLAIREAVKALVEVVLPVGRITCGGHPAITPLLALFVRDADLPSDRVTVFQSAFFSNEQPKEVERFLDVRTTPIVGEAREASLYLMRAEMVRSRCFSAAVLIGGMEGVADEARLFKQFNPHAELLPIASTGAAAHIVYKDGDYDTQLERDLTYASLFRRKLLSRLSD